MPIIPPTQAEIFAQYQAELQALGITNWTESSRAGAWARVSAQYNVDQYNQIAQVDANTNLSSAQGIYLDRIGADFGVTRLPAQAATTLGQGAAVQFTNNGGSDYVVSQGTRVWNPAKSDVAYFTSAAVVVPAGNTALVHVTAVAAGSYYNVGVGVITAHNTSPQVTVTNVRPIRGGMLTEDDDSYRFRIQQTLSSHNGSTSIAIQQALLAVPGVRQVIINPGVRGNGSVDILVMPIATTMSQDLQNACEDAAGQIMSVGISWQILAPINRLINVTIQLRLAPGSIFSSIQPEVQAAVAGYLNNLDVNAGTGNSAVIYNELVTRVMNSDSNILDSAVNYSVDGVPYLQTNFQPNPGERAIANVILVTN